MRNNIITAVAGDKQYIKTDNAFQYDYGLKLIITGIDLPEEYDVHFGNTNSAAAKTVIGDSTGVMIPDEYLLNGEDIHAYLYLHTEGMDNDGESVCHIHIPVVDRAAIAEEEITPIEHNVIRKELDKIEEELETKADAFNGSGSGNIVYIRDAEPDRQFVDFVADLPYTQDLNGLPHPYPEGLSPNIWPGERSYVKEIGSGPACSFNVDFPAGDYTISLMATSDTATQFSINYSSGMFLNSVTEPINNTSRVLVNLSPLNPITMISLSGSSTDEIHFDDIQIVTGRTTDKTYYPTENVCPVGYTSVTISRKGKNLFDESRYVTQNTESDTSNYIRCSIPAEPGEVYTFSVDDPGQYRNRLNNYTTDVAPTVYVREGAPSTFKVLDNYNYISYDYRGVNATSFHRQLEKGVHATEYEPYCEDLYTTSWEDTIGNVVCGTYNAVTGEIICTGAYVTKAWSEFTDKQTTAEYVEGQFTLDAATYADRETMLCDRLYYIETPAVGTFHMDQNNVIHAYVPVGTADSKEFTFYYRTEPVTYQADPSEIRTKAIMTLSADTGDISVEYVIGVKEYVDKSLQDAPVIDVTIKGESIVKRQVAEIPTAWNDKPGVVIINRSNINSPSGLSIDSGGSLTIEAGGSEEIKTGSYEKRHRAITVNTQHIATFYGLAKVAGADMAESSNPVGTYTDEAKTAIRDMLSAAGLDSNGKVPSSQLPSYVDDVVEYASLSAFPQTGESGIIYVALDTNKIYRWSGSTYIEISSGGGTVTDVQVDGVSVLDEHGVANVPVGSTSNYGALKVGSGFVVSNGIFHIFRSYLEHIKAGTEQFRPIVPENQHMSAFYGLAKASGDSTQASSSNAVGNYTDSAKSAISQMLNAPVSVTGTTPSITALAGVRYICGEVSTLDITLPASGCIDVTFTSGATATVMTITPPTGVTVKWANGFDPTSLDANTTYEINIMDGLGVAVSWT